MIHRTSRAIVAALLLGLGACAANPGVVQISPGVYMLSREDKAGVFGNPQAMKASVIKDANSFATSKGMVAIPVSTHEIPMGVLGRFASFEYQFRLVSPDDAAARPTVLTPRADIVVEKNEHKVVEQPGTVASQHADLYGELMKLDDLHKRGILTDAEFEAQKKKLLELQDFPDWARLISPDCTHAE